MNNTDTNKVTLPFSSITKYCIFLGYHRSGHSLIGSLLDAHPEMIIAHELDALKSYSEERDIPSLFEKLLANSKEIASKGRVQTGYDYSVSEQSQGAFTELKVIGDKKGGASTWHVHHNPKILEEFQESLGEIEMEIIHVIRNPFDVIATRARRGKGFNPLKTPTAAELEEEAQVFFQEVEIMTRLKAKSELRFVDIHFEDFIENPSKWLTVLCDCFGVKTNPQYLADCAVIVNPNPHESRKEITWPSDLKNSISEKMKNVSFLTNYQF